MRLNVVFFSRTTSLLSRMLTNDPVIPSYVHAAEIDHFAEQTNRPAAVNITAHVNLKRVSQMFATESHVLTTTLMTFSLP